MEAAKENSGMRLRGRMECATLRGGRDAREEASRKENVLLTRRAALWATIFSASGFSNFAGRRRNAERAVRMGPGLAWLLRGCAGNLEGGGSCERSAMSQESVGSG